MCKVKWAESMHDLKQDAHLWLLHMNGEIKAVIVLFFTEVKLKPEVVSELTIPTTISNNGARSCISNDDEATLPTTLTDHKVNISTIASPSVTFPLITSKNTRTSLIDIINEKTDINLLARGLF